MNAVEGVRKGRKNTVGEDWLTPSFFLSVLSNVAQFL